MATHCVLANQSCFARAPDQAWGGLFSRAPATPKHSMHPAKYKALQDDCGHCVSTANDCLRHCIGMLAMQDDSMNGCIDTAYQVVAACGALQALAAPNSPQVPAFAKATAAVSRRSRLRSEASAHARQARGYIAATALAPKRARSSNAIATKKGRALNSISTI